MIRPQRSVPNRQKRRAAALIEFAFVAPLLALIVMASIDVGQFCKVARVVNDASCEAARQAAKVTVVNEAQVQMIVDDYLADAFNDPAMTATVNVMDGQGQPVAGGSLTTIPSGETVAVEVTFDYETVRWLSAFPNLNSATVETTTMMRRD